MIIVDTDPSVVEATLRAGGFSCPDCGRSLRPWGYGIERDVRSSGRIERRRLRRAICRLGLENMTRSVRGTMETPGRNVKQKQGLNRSLQDAALRRLAFWVCAQSARGWAHKCGS